MSLDPAVTSLALGLPSGSEPDWQPPDKTPDPLEPTLVSLLGGNNPPEMILLRPNPPRP